MNTSRFFTAIAFALAVIALSACSPKPVSRSNELVDYYTCSMHPSVHSREPGKCPICGMELVPVMKKGAQGQIPAGQPASPIDDNVFAVPVERLQQIGVAYSTVEARPLSRTIRAVGTVVPDQKRMWSYVARVDGYVQQLLVTSPGELVEKDAPLLSLYSPDLLTAEREFVTLLGLHREGKGDEVVEAARLRLRRWNITDEQIAELEKSGKPSEVLTLRSPFRGLVSRVAVSQGASVKPGDPLVDVVDLSKVWVWVDFYETEIGALRAGQKVGVAAVSYPGRTFDGTIALVDPFVDPVKRTARARIDVENAEYLLRPGMYVNAELHTEPMTALAIPVEAVMPTGLRNVAFVDKGGGRFEPRFVLLGGRFGDFYAVQKGVSAGERVVSGANFLIDAESKVQGALKDFGGGESPTDGENPAAALASYEALINTYLALHDTLAADRFNDVGALGSKLKQEAASLPAGGKTSALQQAIEKFAPADLAQARVGFGGISAALLEVLKEVPMPRKLYVMRCPMWNSSPSEWVQVSKEVENPFLGHAMATCGETVSQLGK